jgi:hypothetical protein
MAQEILQSLGLPQDDIGVCSSQVSPPPNYFPQNVHAYTLALDARVYICYNTSCSLHAWGVLGEEVVGRIKRAAICAKSNREYSTTRASILVATKWRASIAQDEVLGARFRRRPVVPTGRANLARTLLDRHPNQGYALAYRCALLRS